jgi:hypothetical protein
MGLDAIAAASESTAFSAYYSLVSPALRSAARGPLRRGRHGGAPCRGIDATQWCDDCVQDYHDRLLTGFARLRKTLAGDPPRTRTGEPVRELELVACWITMESTRRENLSDWARLLRGRPLPGEPAEIRAARAQLVHYPVRHLEAEIRRAEAVRRGTSARPDRDLRTAAWAVPLRADKAAFELLLDAVVRLRHGARDPYDIPATQLQALHLDLAEARHRLRRALTSLRNARLDFYLANVATYLEEPTRLLDACPPPAESPEDVYIRDEDQLSARRILSSLLIGNLHTPRRARLRLLVTRICTADSSHDPALPTWTAKEFDLSNQEAERLLRRLINLIATADIDWTLAQCHRTEKSNGLV